MKNNSQHQSTGNGLHEATKEFYTNETTDGARMDGRDIGDEKPIREKDPEVEETRNGELDEIEIGDIRERNDKGEGMEDMPLGRKELEDEQDAYVINGANIEEVSEEHGGKRRNEPKDIPRDGEQDRMEMKDLRRKNENSPTIEYPTI